MRRSATLCLALLSSIAAHSQDPAPVLVGYWHNWNDQNAPYIPLDQVDARYNVITLSFAVPSVGTTYDMEFVPAEESPAAVIADISAIEIKSCRSMAMTPRRRRSEKDRLTVSIVRPR